MFKNEWMGQANKDRDKVKWEKSYREVEKELDNLTVRKNAWLCWSLSKFFHGHERKTNERQSSAQLLSLISTSYG